MMEYRFLFDFGTLGKHCSRCPLSEELGNDCNLQIDENGVPVEFDTYEEQLANCPLKRGDE